MIRPALIVLRTAFWTAISVASLAQYANAMTIDESSITTDNATSSAEDTKDRFLTGKFITLSKHRKLSTSVGNYQLDANTRVVDRRLDPEAETKVTIRFRDDRVSEVTIYQ